MPRKFEPTEEQRNMVRVLAGYGMTQEQIAVLAGVRNSPPWDWTSAPHISLRSGMFHHLKVVPITAGTRASKQEPLARCRRATLTRMPMRGLLAHGDIDETPELDEKLQRPAAKPHPVSCKAAEKSPCSTRTSGKLLYMPARSPDDSGSA